MIMIIHIPTYLSTYITNEQASMTPGLTGCVVVSLSRAVLAVHTKNIPTD